MMNVIYGTPGEDVIVGTHAPDLIFSFGGNDRICSAGGNDVVLVDLDARTGKYGADGWVKVDAGGGDDSVHNYSFSYDDWADKTLQVHGGPGDDHIIGGKGSDHLDGNEGLNYIHGGYPTHDRQTGDDPNGYDRCYASRLIMDPNYSGEGHSGYIGGTDWCEANYKARPYKSNVTGPIPPHPG